MDMDHAAAADLLGNGRQISRENFAVSLKEIWVDFRRGREFWLLLVVAFVALPAACASFVYVFKSVRLLRYGKLGLPIPDSALNEQLQALQLHSPWHDKAVGANQVCNTSECVHAAYHLLYGINQAADPCDDFYEFSCGNWIKLYKYQGLAYNSRLQEMRISENALVKEILMRSPESYDFLPMKTAAIFFHQCVNEDNVDSVVNLTTKLGGWPSLEGENWNEDGFDLVTALAFIYQRYLLSIFVDFNIVPHGVNESVSVLQLAVPDFTSGEQFKNETFMTAYKSLYNKILSELTGLTERSEQQVQDADDMFKLEEALALAVTIPDEHANVTSTEDSFTLAEFQEYLEESLNYLNKPLTNCSISWKRLLNEIFSTSGVQVNDDQLLIVADLGYFSRMSQILDATPKRTIANYVSWSVAFELLPEASRKIERMVEEFALQTGQPVDLKPRKTYCFLCTVPFFGVPIMHEYLKTKSDLEARAVVTQMTTNLQATFDKILENNHWLSDAAKLTAQKKLRALKTFIGYPSWLLNATEIEARFEGLNAGSNFIETFGNVAAWMSNKLFRELGKIPSDLEEPWFAAHELAMSFSFDEYALIVPSSVQAYHVGSHNFLVLPMGFIQPHHFYNNVPSYVNYGRLGVVIGHEMVHGFDVSRKNLDENGQFNDQTWSDDDEEEYEEKSNCFRDQYNKFEVLPGIYINGSGSLDENIADNGGLKIAYLTYNKDYARAGNDEQRLPGFEKLSAEQLFFLSYGSLWCEHGIELVRKLLLQLDRHSPGKYRINGALQNSQEFADAWNCPAGMPMNPMKKCKLW